MNNIEIIGIDHGWSQMKTSNTCFNTSIKELANAPAFHDNVLEYDDRYFAVGEERLEVLDSKVENENFYLLTLVAIAKELEIRGKSEADVVLAVGLPLTRFSAERKPFIDYLSKNGDVVFGFEQKLYRIHILSPTKEVRMVLPSTRMYAILSPQNFVRSFTVISLRNMKECRHRESRRKEQKRM